jgi:hypothetical protein
MMNRSIIAAVAIAVLASSFSVSPGFARTGGANGASAGTGAAAAGPGGNGGPVQVYDRVPPRHYLPYIAIDSKKFRCGQQFEGRAAYDFDDQSSLYCKQ